MSNENITLKSDVVNRSHKKTIQINSIPVIAWKMFKNDKSFQSPERCTCSCSPYSKVSLCNGNNT